jgi:hypothetical protein
MRSINWQTVAVAVAAVALLNQIDATRGIVSGGNRYFR